MSDYVLIYTFNSTWDSLQKTCTEQVLSAQEEFFMFLSLISLTNLRLDGIRAKCSISRLGFRGTCITCFKQSKNNLRS